MNRVSLVVWRDAKTDPPDPWSRKITDQGYAEFSPSSSTGPGGWEDVESGRYYNPQPSVWADFPTPPGDDALTTDHLRVLAEAARYARKQAVFDEDEHDLLVEAEDRLRRALEQMEGT